MDVYGRLWTSMDVYGRRQLDRRRDQPEHPQSGRVVMAPSEWHALLPDRCPAYLSWEQYERNQARLAANRARASTLGAVRQGAARFVSVQNEYSLMHRQPEKDVLPECVRRRLAFLPYFPLASGLLTGKYRAGQALPPGSRGESGWGPKVFTEENLGIADSLREFAKTRGHSLLELAFSWLASRPAVASVIAGAKSPEQAQTNARAAGWKLTEAELVQVDRILAPHAAKVLQ